MSRGTCDVCIRGKGHVACDALHGDRVYIKKYQQMSSLQFKVHLPIDPK